MNHEDPKDLEGKPEHFLVEVLEVFAVQLFMNERYFGAGGVRRAS